VEAEVASSEAEVAAAMTQPEPERVVLMHHAPKHNVPRYDKVLSVCFPLRRRTHHPAKLPKPLTERRRTIALHTQENFEQNRAVTAVEEPRLALEMESVLRTLSCFHRWRLSSAKRSFARELQSILTEIQHDDDAMQSMTRRLQQRDAFVCTLEAEVGRLRAASQADAATLESSRTRIHALEAELVLLRNQPPPRPSALLPPPTDSAADRSEAARVAAVSRREREDGERERRGLIEQLARRDDELATAAEHARQLELQLAGSQAALAKAEATAATFTVQVRACGAAERQLVCVVCVCMNTSTVCVCV
jgi:hypothetical protein